MTQQTIEKPQVAQAPVAAPQAAPDHMRQRPIYQQRVPVAVPMPQPAPGLAAAQEAPSIIRPMFFSLLLGGVVGAFAMWKLSSNKYFRAFQNADEYED